MSYTHLPCIPSGRLNPSFGWWRTTSSSGSSFTSGSSTCRWKCTQRTKSPPTKRIAPPSQIPGLNLTQFNNIGNFRPNMAQHIPRPYTRACRARNLFNWSPIELFATKIQYRPKLFSTWHELSNLIPSSPHECDKHVHTCWSLIATALHTMWDCSKITEPPEKVWRLFSQFKLFDPK